MIIPFAVPLVDTYQCKAVTRVKARYLLAKKVRVDYIDFYYDYYLIQLFNFLVDKADDELL